jgi:hypothetical protein
MTELPDEWWEPLSDREKWIFSMMYTAFNGMNNFDKEHSIGLMKIVRQSTDRLYPVTK